MSSSRPDAKVSEYQVGPGMFVELAYQVRDSEGESVGPDDALLNVVFGMGQLLPKVEDSIAGKCAGQTASLRLGERDAYGPRDPEAVVEVERSEFPEDVAAGDFFEVENPDGELLVLRVLEVLDDGVRVDLNHPLAGQDLDVTVSVKSVRPATQEELAIAMKSGLDPEADDGHAIIAPQSLLKGPKRR